MIYFNFYFVMSVCLWRYALFDGSKEGQTLQSSGFLAGITGSCQKSHLDSVHKLFLTAWPCLQPCKYFKALIYNCDIRKQGRTHTNEKPWACKQYGEVFRYQSYLQFQEKKNLVSSLCYQSLEASKLFAMFTKVLFWRSQYCGLQFETFGVGIELYGKFTYRNLFGGSYSPALTSVYLLL